MKQSLPSGSDIERAYYRIRGYVHETPVLTCSGINAIAGASLYFKCENFQKVGAFKYRGATNAVLCLTEKERLRGVATHSSGNHAAALALAAAKQGIPATIVMPDNAPEIKKKAVAAYGATIVFCESTLDAREKTLKQVIDKTGAVMIHPYNQREVICGQGTAALELLKEKEDLDMVMTPVGGGGLLSGTATYVKDIHPHIEIVAGEPLNADDAYRSFYSGSYEPVHNPDTIADGLRTSLGDLTYAIIKDKVDGIFTVTEDAIISAMRLVWERMKIIIEPSSAVPLAAILQKPDYFKRQQIGIIVTGGNVDVGRLPF